MIAAFAGPLAYSALLERRRLALSYASRRAAWGHAPPEARNLTEVRRYSELRAAASPGNEVDATTWRDLDMDAVFGHLDRSETFAGRARLYDRLRSPGGNLEALSRFDEVVTTLANDDGARERVQSVLASMDPYAQDAVLEVLFATVPSPPRLQALYLAVSLAIVAALAASFVFPAALPVVLGLAAVAIALRIGLGRRQLAWTPALRATSAVLHVARRLARSGVPALEPELARMRTARARLAGFARATGWLTVDTLRSSELLAAIFTYLNAFFLVDLVALSYVLRTLPRMRGDVRLLFDAVGDLDAAVAVASFRAGASHWTRPELDTAAEELRLEAAAHPLLLRPVPNTVHVEGRGVLVTGPNMSGKSTFVRTVAINALLARTIYTVVARRYHAPPLRIRTLMSADDDIQKSRSYYRAELETAKAMLAPEAGHERLLVVVDELFRGTNTNERIGAGAALLAALQDAGNFVFASTHDGELVSLLRDCFDPYHFAERVIDGEIIFPFQLCRGPATTRNAIALLRQVGFPPAVVDRASEIAEALDRSTRAVDAG
ncbi:MAG TPA: hypothetical protein VEK07_25070 [Polyangiaceae bacterium]|nr:hypothetical protein [Polyangiaceae bacterium]